MYCKARNPQPYFYACLEELEMPPTRVFKYSCLVPLLEGGRVPRSTSTSCLRNAGKTVQSGRAPVREHIFENPFWSSVPAAVGAGSPLHINPRRGDIVLHCRHLGQQPRNRLLRPFVSLRCQDCGKTRALAFGLVFFVCVCVGLGFCGFFVFRFFFFKFHCPTSHEILCSGLGSSIHLRPWSLLQ